MEPIKAQWTELLLLTCCPRIVRFPSLSHTDQPTTHTAHTSLRSAAITLTHKAARQWVSGRWLPWQHIPSLAAAWSEVWCCWTSPLSLLCTAACTPLFRDTNWCGPQTISPRAFVSGSGQTVFFHSHRLFPDIPILYASAMMKPWCEAA